ncbi:hypothetical protein BV898_14921 [Hypsibius exemplaris]|uniref:Uncharacterized protein n=1 Tax=Hypsibius exemplaris TaxID=2072580 RepID=A0A9X6RJR4_HYPEX|nr:hypothetical protein BV898_14921 [Hypsibius exemplaris]
MFVILFPHSASPDNNFLNTSPLGTRNHIRMAAGFPVLSRNSPTADPNQSDVSEGEPGGSEGNTSDNISESEQTGSQEAGQLYQPKISAAKDLKNRTRGLTQFRTCRGRETIPFGTSPSGTRPSTTADV